MNETASPITIQPVAANDAERLLQLSRQTFFDAFAHQNHAADMEAFAATSFTLASFQEQLANPDSRFFYAMVGDEPAGYLKLNYNAAQTEFREADALEIERIYVLSAYQGRRIGQQLIHFAIGKAIEQHLRYLWLGVWEHNHGAIRFYQNQGFSIFSSHPFMLGTDEQTDLLMRKEL